MFRIGDLVTADDFGAVVTGRIVGGRGECGEWTTTTGDEIDRECTIVILDATDGARVRVSGHIVDLWHVDTDDSNVRAVAAAILSPDEIDAAEADAGRDQLAAVLARAEAADRAVRAALTLRQLTEGYGEA